MKRKPIPVSPFSRITPAATAVAALLSFSVLAQTIPNPSFEANNFTVPSGLIGDNTAITGWTTTTDFSAGLNPAGGTNQYANNGIVPDGNNVAFLLYYGSLGTTMSGLTAGQKYKVTFRANASTPASAGAYPAANIAVDGLTIHDLTVYNTGTNNPYAYVAFEFFASGATATLTIVNDTAFGIGPALLIDDFKIAPSDKWSVVAWTGDADSDADPNYLYTHAYNFGSSASPIINGIGFFGVPGVNPAVPGSFSTTNFVNVYNGDQNAVTGLGGTSSAVLARDFIYSGSPVGQNNPQTIKLEGLTPGTEYVLTLYTFAWEDPTLENRWGTIAVGDDRLTINQDAFYNNNGMRISCRYTADATGTVTVKINPMNPNNMSLHMYGFSNREAATRNFAPVITLQPKPAALVLAQGQPLTYSVLANGVPSTLTYTWRLNGQPISGANSATYNIPSISPANEGNYDVVVANSSGSVTSVVSRLTVGLPLNNPSFEADTFTVYPGYNSGNPPGITGWSSLGGHGINPIADGQSPFADNGVIPHGNQVAFMQNDGPLSQLVSGFIVGAQYSVHYYENSRTTVTPAMEVRVAQPGVATNTVLPAHLVPYVGGANPYYERFSETFVATATAMEVSFIKSNPLGGDSTALIDNVTVLPVAAGTAPFMLFNPQSVAVQVGDSTRFWASAGGSLPLTYQWLKDGAPINGANTTALSLTLIQKPDEADYALKVSNSSGSITSLVAHLTVYEPIPTLFNTGLDDRRAPLADGLADPHYTLIENADTNSTYAIVEDSTVFPIVGGPWLADNATSKWIGPQFNTSASAVGQYVYRTTFDLTDRDVSTVFIIGRWSTDNAGTEIRVNGVSVGFPQDGFDHWTSFSIFATNVSLVAGTNTLDFVVQNVAAIGYTGVKVEYTASNVKIPAGVRPEITMQPISQTVVEGDTVTFTADARGAAPLYYHWNKNGNPISGEVTRTLTLTNVTTADNGAYTITVTNQAGRVTSDAAQLVVAWRVVPGAFGTGVAADGSLLPPGSTDPHYILTSSDDPLWPGPNAIVINDGWPIQLGVWVVNGPNSKWIGAKADQSADPTTGGNDAGYYIYQTAVDLTGKDASKIHLDGAWAVDNTGTDLKLNGVSTGWTSGGFGGLTPFTLTNLIAGMNTLDFTVFNATNETFTPNPAGLRVDLRALISLAAPAPTLQITASGTKYIISWSPDAAGQQLQFAPAVSGPWNPVANQTNPYTNVISGSQFFRVFTP